LVLVSQFAEPALMVLLASALLRWLMAWAVSGYTGDEEVRRGILWLPVRDLLSAAVWLAGLAGRHVTWRGERFELHSDGRMEPARSRAEVEEKRAW